MEVARRVVARTGLPGRLSALLAEALTDPEQDSVADRRQMAETDDDLDGQGAGLFGQVRVEPGDCARVGVIRGGVRVCDTLVIMELSNRCVR